METQTHESGDSRFILEIRDSYLVFVVTQALAFLLTSALLAAVLSSQTASSKASNLGLEMLVLSEVVKTTRRLQGDVCKRFSDEQYMKFHARVTTSGCS